MNIVTKKNIEIERKPRELYKWVYTTLDNFKSKKDL